MDVSPDDAGITMLIESSLNLSHSFICMFAETASSTVSTASLFGTLLIGKYIQYLSGQKNQ